MGTFGIYRIERDGFGRVTMIQRVRTHGLFDGLEAFKLAQEMERHATPNEAGHPFVYRELVASAVDEATAELERDHKAVKRKGE